MPLGVNVWMVVTSIAWATVLLWLGGALLTARTAFRHRRLAPLSDRRLTGADAPLVSILVPARNEEHRVLERAVRSMLAQDYGRFEVVAVNDRSTDATGPILRSVAADDARLRVLDGTEPPAGWLGKPNALQQAFAASRGEWMLATDADVIFTPSAVRTVVALALDKRFDAVTLLPHIICLSFWERVFMPTFGWYMLIMSPLEHVNDASRPEAAIGVGGFFLIRRTALERVGGYRAVRSEVVEDVRMAKILKASGARLRIDYAPELAATRMQTNLSEIWEGFTKNLFAGAEFALGKTAACTVAVILFGIAPPLVALLCALMLWTGGAHFWSQLFLPTSLVWMIQVAIFAAANRVWGIPMRYALTVPLGHALFIAILTNSTLRILNGSGVTWKGRKLYERAGVRPPRGR